MPRATTDISVVIPVYNSEGCLEELASRLTGALNAMKKTYEILLVNDCSTDNSWDRILRIAGKDPRIRGIHLRRNFGQQGAIMAGLNHSTGRAVILMDDDLQHDPSDIPALLAELEKGYDACYANFRVKRQTWFKNFGSRINDRVANIILRKPREIYLSPFKAIRREVVEEILKYEGPYPYINGLIFRVTRNITQIRVEHHERFAGTGNFRLRQSMRLWLKLATNFSVFPLRIATILGFLSSCIGFLMALLFFLLILLGVETPTGWPSLIITILFLGGIQLVSLGIIGEYVGRLFLHHSKEPQYVIREMTEE